MSEEKERDVLKEFIKPHILKKYRELIGYSIDEVSKKTGIPKNRLEFSENVEIDLTVQELDKISYLYRVPFGDFLFDSVNEDNFLQVVRSKFQNPDDVSIFLKFYRVFSDFINDMILLGIFPEKETYTEPNDIEHNYYYLLENRQELENKGVYVFYIPSSVPDYIHVNYDGYECYLVGVHGVYVPERMRDLSYMRYVFGDLFIMNIVKTLDNENIPILDKIKIYNLLYDALDLDININTYEYFDNMVLYFKNLYKSYIY
ncbi:MAG: helix-turn-helix transcriptional regulator [Candidatus Aenigmatarchaeota archaeon]